MVSRRTLFSFLLLLTIQTVSWVSATRPLQPHDRLGVGVHQPDQSPQASPSPFTIDPNLSSSEEGYTVNSKIGSTPPICEHKCHGCTPCEAIQVPTISTLHSHLGVQYANYEPESWKCKCGPSVYTP